MRVHERTRGAKLTPQQSWKPGHFMQDPKLGFSHTPGNRKQDLSFARSQRGGELGLSAPDFLRREAFNKVHRLEN